MLVLSRKAGECIRVRESVAVTELRVAGPAVRLGIGAPREAPGLRGELLAHPSAFGVGRSNTRREDLGVPWPSSDEPTSRPCGSAGIGEPG
ncbi:carbon storage regulator [Botrimarina sp.]|uniref:carbon storage regulator n=1 Tax=Botrimarina sp. TaxID=2795802 RepID=UPI0032EF2B0A